MEWLFFLIPIVPFGFGFATALLSGARARVATLVALIVLPVVGVVTAITTSMSSEQLGRELSWWTASLLFGLPALGWAAIALLGHDLGRRKRRRHR